MHFTVKKRHLPGRLVVGAFILNSGVGKLSADADTATQLHGFAAGTYPFLAPLQPTVFVRLLALGEMSLGAALLLPVVPTVAAGAGLTAFSAGLLGLYLRTPGMRKPGSLAPTEDGIPLAKDSWMAAMGLGFVIDELSSGSRQD
jgi:hypothetical protein